MEVTERTLKAQFGFSGKYAPYVMSDRFKRVPRKKGEPQKYEVETFPTEEELNQAMRVKYTQRLDDLVSEACSDLESLKDELQEWFDNLPEQFQSGSKGDELQEAIDALENIGTPDMAPFGGLMVYCPPLYIRPESRGDRRDVAMHAVETAKQALEEAQESILNGNAEEDQEVMDLLATFEVSDANELDFDEALQQLSEIVETAQDVTFPRMM